MAIKSLILTEKLATQNPRATSVAITRESVKRFPTYVFGPDELYIENGNIKASAHKVSLNKDKNPIAENKTTEIDLSSNCVITVRLEPPFNEVYYTAMQMLARLRGNSYVTNPASAIANLPEKLIPAEVQKFTPPTLITADHDKIRAFWKKHKDIVLKPLYEFGGRHVMRLRDCEENHLSIFRFFKDDYKEPIIAQKYLPEVKKGDKRAIFIDGKLAWQLVRIPAKHTLQAGVDVGGSFHKCELTAKEKQICKALEPFLKKHDIFHCGIDLIGEYITEMNITCPALFTPINELYNIKSEKIYWDRLENKLKKLNLA